MKDMLFKQIAVLAERDFLCNEKSDRRMVITRLGIAATKTKEKETKEKCQELGSNTIHLYAVQLSSTSKWKWNQGKILSSKTMKIGCISRLRETMDQCKKYQFIDKSAVNALENICKAYYLYGTSKNTLAYNFDPCKTSKTHWRVRQTSILLF